MNLNENITKRVWVAPIGVADKLLLAQITLEPKFVKLGIFDAINLKARLDNSNRHRRQNLQHFARKNAWTIPPGFFKTGGG